MTLSARTRISAGFGVVLTILVCTGISNWVLINGIERHIGEFGAAIAQRSEGEGMELQVATLRVRVNQWLRSMNPDFSRQADALLAQFGPMATRAETTATTDKTRGDIQSLLRSTSAYTVSWEAIKRLYADEARLYDGALATDSAQIHTDLARARQAETADGTLPAILLLADAQRSIGEAETFAVPLPEAALKPPTPTRWPRRWPSSGRASARLSRRQKTRQPAVLWPAPNPEPDNGKNRSRKR